MEIIHYKAGMDRDGNIAMTPVAYDHVQPNVMPVVNQTSQPTYQAVTEPRKPEPVQGIPIPLIVIGGLLCFLVLNPGNSSGPTVSELQIQNQHLRQRIDQLEYQLIGVYSEK